MNAHLCTKITRLRLRVPFGKYYCTYGKQYVKRYFEPNSAVFARSRFASAATCARQTVPRRNSITSNSYTRRKTHVHILIHLGNPGMEPRPPLLGVEQGCSLLGMEQCCLLPGMEPERPPTTTDNSDLDCRETRKNIHPLVPFSKQRYLDNGKRTNAARCIYRKMLTRYFQSQAVRWVRPSCLGENRLRNESKGGVLSCVFYTVHRCQN